MFTQQIKNILVFVIVPLTLVSFTGAAYLLNANDDEPFSNHTEQLKSKLGPDMLEILQDPDSVKIVNLKTDENDKVLVQATIEKVQKLLLEDSSYFFNQTKYAIFDPDLYLSFSKDNKKLRVIVSRHAKQVEFVYQQTKVRLDIDPIFDALIKELINE